MRRLGPLSGQAQSLRAARSQVEMTVVRYNGEPGRPVGQCCTQLGQQRELLGRSQISPGRHMPQRSQRAGKATDRAVWVRVGQGASGKLPPD